VNLSRCIRIHKSGRGGQEDGRTGRLFIPSIRPRRLLSNPQHQRDRGSTDLQSFLPFQFFPFFPSAVVDPSAARRPLRWRRPARNVDLRVLPSSASSASAVVDPRHQRDRCSTDLQSFLTFLPFPSAVVDPDAAGATRADAEDREDGRTGRLFIPSIPLRRLLSTREISVTAAQPTLQSFLTFLPFLFFPSAVVDPDAARRSLCVLPPSATSASVVVDRQGSATKRHPQSSLQFLQRRLL